MTWARWTIHIIGEARGWKRGVRDEIEYGLAVLLAGRVDGEPVLHSEMFPFLRKRVIGVGRTSDVLKRMGMFRDDRRPSFEDWLTGKLDGLTPGISRDVEAWLRILHDGGPRNKARAPATVWGYMNRIRPILLTWSDRYDHLREVTRGDVQAAIDQLHGHRRRHALISLRSLFSRAKKNGTIFRDPTLGLKVGQHHYGVLQPPALRRHRPVRPGRQDPRGPESWSRLPESTLPAWPTCSYYAWTTSTSATAASSSAVGFACSTTSLTNCSPTGSAIVRPLAQHRQPAPARQPQDRPDHHTSQRQRRLAHPPPAGRHYGTAAHGSDPRRSPRLRRRPAPPRLGLRPRHQDRHPLRRQRARPSGRAASECS